MKTFNDNAGRTWTVAINVDAIKRVKGLAGVNLLDVIAGKKGDRDLLARLSADPILLCDVLYALCKPEADPRNIGDEDFGRAMAGDAIDHATTALLEELVDFFPKDKRRVLGKALGKLRTLEARVLDVAEQKIESPQIEALMEKALADLPDLDQELAELLRSTQSDSSTNSPASPASTPAPGP